MALAIPSLNSVAQSVFNLPGDQLQGQVQDQLDERKKKLMAAAGTQAPAGVAMGANNGFTPTMLGVFGPK